MQREGIGSIAKTRVVLLCFLLARKREKSGITRICFLQSEFVSRIQKDKMSKKRRKWQENQGYVFVFILS